MRVPERSRKLRVYPKCMDLEQWAIRYDECVRPQSLHRSHRYASHCTLTRRSQSCTGGSAGEVRARASAFVRVWRVTKHDQGGARPGATCTFQS
jgi:hypothetical protein